MSWILIIAIAWSTSSLPKQVKAIATAEFNSREACDQAAGMLRLNPDLRDVHTLCVPKGER